MLAFGETYWLKSEMSDEYLGKLKALYTRNQITLCKENLLSIEGVGTEEVSVREVVNKLSLVCGQGFRKCNCSKKCTTKTCLCKSANLLCNSKCHNSQHLL